MITLQEAYDDDREAEYVEQEIMRLADLGVKMGNVPTDSLLAIAAHAVETVIGIERYQSPSPRPSYVVPAAATGLGSRLNIRWGGFHTSTKNVHGWYAMQIDTHDTTLNHDGTWDKYGQPFETAELALELATTTEHTDRYGRLRGDTDEYYAELLAAHQAYNKYADVRITIEEFRVKFDLKKERGW